MGDYDELLGVPHPAARSPMPRGDRAAQFAPFAALSGLEETLGETARLTDHRVPLSAEEQTALNTTLQRLQLRIADRPTVTCLCFEEDASKEGGRYVTVSGRVRVINTTLREMVLDDHRRLPLDAVCAITEDT